MTENFTVRELVAISQAFVLFGLFLFVPGYVLGWAAGLFEFRRRRLLTRFAASVALSIAVFPILTYLSWHCSFRAVQILYAGCCLAFVSLLAAEWRLWTARPRMSKHAWWVMAIAAGWVLFSMLCLVDWQIGNRLYFPTVAYDYMLRAAITSSITRTGVPPANPYFFPGHAVPLRYHYFWFLACSLVEQLGGGRITARQAMLGGTLWSGIGLMSVIALYLRFFQARGAAHIEKRTLFGIALLGVTGLDIVPVLILEMGMHRVLATNEWWNDIVAAWVNSVLWVPHHVACLVACLAGFLIVWHARNRRSATARALAGVAAGLSFASAVGLSVYVTFVFAAFLAVWTTVRLMKKSFSEVALLCFSALSALAACGLFVHELLEGGGGNAAGGALTLSVRPFAMADGLIRNEWPGLPAAAELVNLLLLPLNYFMELGFFFVAGWLMWNKVRHTSTPELSESCGMTMLATGLVICTFFRSSVISSNDLGWRGVLVVQFILLIWGTELLDGGILRKGADDAASAGARLASRTRRRTVVLLVLGVLSTIYEVSKIRFYPLISDDFEVKRYKWLSPDGRLGRRTEALRTTYDGLRKILPGNAVVQHNPYTIAGDLFYGLYADRQAAAETAGCGVVFGGDPASCRAVIDPLDELFRQPRAIAAASVDSVCESLSIDAVVVKDTDPVWKDRESWVWKKNADLANDYARAFLCGKVAAGREANRRGRTQQAARLDRQ